MDVVTLFPVCGKNRTAEICLLAAHSSIMQCRRFRRGRHGVGCPRVAAGVTPANLPSCSEVKDFLLIEPIRLNNGGRDSADLVETCDWDILG